MRKWPPLCSSRIAQNTLGDKLKGFVIDLRNNPGGLLEEAVTVSDTFLDRGEIVSTRGRNAEETQRRSAKPGDLTQPGHIFPLMAQPGGVLTRAGHTEAASDLCLLAGMEPADA